MGSEREGPGHELPRWTILSVTTLSSFMAALDSNIVTIALPEMARALNTGVSLLGWVITGYILAAAALVLQSGKLGDSYGKKRVYLVGFAIFGISSALCGLSQSAYELIAFRVVQGIGASVLTATSIPLIFSSFPPSERGQAIGVNSVAWAVGAVAGPLAGGALTQIDWRLIFYVNVPVAAAAILIGTRRIPASLNGRDQHAGRLNLASAALLGLAVGALMLWLSFFDWRLVPVSLAGLALFIVAESRSKNPILNRELIRNRGFVLAISALATLQVAFFGISFVMTFYFQTISGFSPLLAGLWLSPLPVALAVFNPIAGRVFDKFRRSMAVSLVAAVCASSLLLVLSSSMGSPPSLSSLLILGGIGVTGGFVWAPIISSALKFSRPELRGVANGTAFTLIYVSFSVSVAIVVSVSAAALPPSLAGEIYLGSVSGLAPSQAALFAGGLAKSLVALAGVAALGVPMLMLVLREQARKF